MPDRPEETEPPAPVALVLTGNLFFIPRIESAAIRSGMEAVYGNSAAGLLRSTAGREVALALVDLETEESAWVDGVALLTSVLKRDGEPSAPLIAYGPHGDADTLRKARALGCDAVLTKRDFSSRLLELMKTRGRPRFPRSPKPGRLCSGGGPKSDSSLRLMPESPTRRKQRACSTRTFLSPPQTA